MMTLEYGDISLTVLNEYSITKSSQEVTFNSITCEFTGYTQEDLPEKYQEIKLIENNEVKFFGYLDSYVFGEMRELDVETTIEITLLSPMELATLRTVILSGTYKLVPLLSEIFQPLIDDGFTLQEVDIKNRTVSVNFQLNTVEYCANNLSNNYNFWWFIDEQKNIYVKDIDNMLSNKPDFTYDDDNRIPYLQYIKPSSSSDGYANVVNFKNVRVFQASNLEMSGSTISNSVYPMLSGQLSSAIENGGQIDFEYPCTITASNIVKAGEDQAITYSTLYGLYISGTYSDSTTFEVSVSYDQTTGKYSMSNNLGYSDKNDDKEFLLIEDSFYNNLITGIKYNNEEKNIKSIEVIKSNSVLVYSSVRFYNDSEIANQRGKISDTGIIETTVDISDSWKTLSELTDIGASYINNNSTTLDDTIELKVDTVCYMEVGDTIQINKMFFSGTYIITNISEQFSNNMSEFVITAKRGNMLSNFIDIFRGENTEDSESTTYDVSILHYAEENINEKFEVVK